MAIRGHWVELDSCSGCLDSLVTGFPSFWLSDSHVYVPSTHVVTTFLFIEFFDENCYVCIQIYRSLLFLLKYVRLVPVLIATFVWLQFQKSISSFLPDSWLTQIKNRYSQNIYKYRLKLNPLWSLSLWVLRL